MSVELPQNPSAYRRWRATLPGRVESRWGRFLAWLDMQVMDHGFMRPYFNRPYEFAPGLLRSNQPTPARIGRLAARGVRTVVNLRGPSDRGAYVLERRACEQHGVELIDLDMASRKPPKPDKVRRLLDILDHAEKPVLLHCKSGADRAGLAAALYLIHQGRAVETAQRQLSFRFLHIKQAQTGVLDQFLEDYRLARRENFKPFLEWLEQDYDHKALRKRFKPEGWASVLVDRILRRE